MAASPEKYSEKEIVEGCVANDRFFQEILYRRYFAGMMRMCMRYTHDREVALEIVNDGLLRVFQKLHTFSFRGSLEGWIRRLVFRSLADYYRKASKQVYFLDIEDRDAPTPSSAFDELFLEDVLRLVDKLPKATREVFVLFAIEGYQHPEIADMLGISVGTSKWRLSAARQKLKQLIRNNFKSRNYAG